MIKILFIGDSITAERHGSGITVFSELLSVRLPSENPSITWGTYTTGYAVADSGFVNHGHGGWATQFYDNGIYTGGGFKEVFKTEALNEHPDIVTIMLGTNDHYSENQTTVHVPLINYKANLESFVDQLRNQNPNVKIILISPPPMVDIVGSPLKKADNVRVGTYAQAVSEVATLKNTRFIDLYNHLWDLSNHNLTTFGTTYTLDGCHLNQTGQNILADLVKDELIDIIIVQDVISETKFELDALSSTEVVSLSPANNVEEIKTEIFMGGVEFNQFTLLDVDDPNASNFEIYLGTGQFKRFKKYS